MLALVLADCSMPEMNGYDFLVTARENRDWKYAIIAMVATETEMHQMQGALEAGANEFVVKPFIRDTLPEKRQLVGPGTD